MAAIAARLRTVLTYGGMAVLALLGLGAFLDDHTTAGWSCAAAVAGILFRELLHIAEQKVNA